MQNGKKLGFVSLFSGSGGLDLGLREAGFHPALSVENDETCNATLLANDPEINLSSHGDIFELASSKILKESGFKRRQLPLLVGGPPCQPFSKSSYWSNPSDARMTDPRAQCLVEYMRVAEDLLPHTVLIENVTGIGYSGKNDGLQFIKQRFREINQNNNTDYRPCIKVLNAADYGVPQIRKRLFIIAFRNGSEFVFPENRFYDPQDDLNPRTKMEPYRTVWDAIGDLKDEDAGPELKLRGKWGDLLPSIPEGHNYLWHTNKSGGLPLFGWRTRYWSFLLKLDRNKPSWTITATPGPATGPFHWKDRNLSIKELQRLQTYPDEYLFEGTMREKIKQIGNSVPPAIGELLGLAIREQYFGLRSRQALRLIPKSRAKPKKKLLPKKVPEKYKALVADHSEHPGIGRGPGARSDKNDALRG